ncbi:cyclohexanecarboxylate-CoA ligase [Rhodococcus sp. 05-2256-B2]|uniref:AMP-binding protein n=1 Tax=Nocardiaceae TaxID=85025 RepID=UPI00050C9056|nr:MULTISPECIES: AMP-binding protein [Rhodococcus]OZD78961.1 cyclohexanecarboxylate-CoA ligase [Rhodococcus sp. 05-2256-B4]OZD94064.1 cyclohexanecarboxylate-CoA ligase [Rhodococcus sp. 05-2256-B3]OZE01162.1 cyclohexanecarboxylate-CoA ligase [Rhodococcus sp. 05-2256-B2]OZE04766.1 cyclohexanecarboxylate-CoA ligase [Rhodococcus sp. 05-2256-B1]
MLPTRPPSADLAHSYRTGGQWNDRPIGYYLTRAARMYPDAVAVVDGARRVTFAEIDRDATRLAAALHARGVTSDDVVSFQLPNCVEAVVVFQAVMKLGAVANPIVPIYRSRELRFILGQSRAKVAFVPAELRGVDVDAMYRDLADDLPGLEFVVSLAGWDDLLDRVTDEMISELRSRTAPSADEVCLLLYTSGTTADPKGALHSHNTLVYENSSMIDWFGLNETDVIFNPSPVTHVTGVNCALVLPFLLGTSVVLQQTWDPAVALGHIVDEQCSFMIFSTPFLRGLLDEAESAQVRTPSIRYIVCGGADVPDTLTAAATTRLGTVVRMYGATEGPSVTTADRWDSSAVRQKSDGRPIAPTEVIVSNGAGGVGEILWRGPDTFLGYLDPTLNDDAFTDDGFFRTGDLGRFDSDGAIHVVGRIKDIINRSGEKISAHDVENQLGAHPSVIEVAVVAGPDSLTGERGCAFVVTRDRRDLTLDEVHRFLVDRDIAVQKIPESIFVVDSLPKTASGKVQKFALRNWTRDRAAVPAQMAAMTFAASHER